MRVTDRNRGREREREIEREKQGERERERERERRELKRIQGTNIFASTIHTENQCKKIYIFSDCINI